MGTNSRDGKGAFMIRQACPERDIPCRNVAAVPRDSVQTSWRRLRAAGAWAAFGDGIVAVAVPLLAIETTHDPVAVAGVTAALYVPWALATAFGPALLAGADRRTVMGGLDTARALAMGWLGADALLGNVGLPTLYAVAVISGLAVTLVDDAERETASAIAPALRGRRVGGGIAAAEVVADGFVGLPIGALLFEFLVPLPFFAVAFTSTVAALLALSVAHGPDPATDRAVSARPARELRDAFGELLGDTGGRALAFVAAAVSLLGSVVVGPLVLLAVIELGLGALGFGVLLTAIAGGSLLGGLITPDIARRTGHRPMLGLALVAGGAGYGAAAVTEETLVVGALLAVGALAGMAVTVTTGMVRRRGEPAGRALHLLSWAAIPIGALAGGVVADVWGLQAPLVAAGAGFAALLPVVLLASPQPVVGRGSAVFAKIG